jgi:hypothetical protein
MLTERTWGQKKIIMYVRTIITKPDGKRFAVLSMPEAAGGEHDSVDVTMLLNFFGEVRRRAPIGKQPHAPIAAGTPTKQSCWKLVDWIEDVWSLGESSIWIPPVKPRPGLFGLANLRW